MYIANAVTQNNVPMMKAPDPYPGSLTLILLASYAYCFSPSTTALNAAI